MSAGQAPSRVLWVTPRLGGEDLGERERSRRLLDGLASRIRTDLLLAGPLGDAYLRERLQQVFELPARDPPRPRSGSGRRVLELALLGGLPQPSLAYPAALDRIGFGRALARMQGRYEVVVLDGETLAPLTPPSGARSVLSIDRVWSRAFEQDVAAARSRRLRLLRTGDLLKARRLERHALRRHQATIVTSVAEAAALERAGAPGQASTAVILNGADTGRLLPTPLPPQPRVLLPGSLAFPDADSARWFCDEVWGAVRQRRPDAQLILAGRHVAPEILRLDQLSGVEVHPNVPAMAAYYRWARAVVLPVRRGAGSRLNATEALASGRPIVATAAALEGLAIRDGAQARLADAPDRFAAAVCEVLLDDTHAAQLGAAARRHAEAELDWSRAAEQLIDVLRFRGAGPDQAESAHA